MTNEDNLKDLNEKEVRDSYEASILVGVIGLGTLIVLGMIGVIIVAAAMSGAASAVRP